MTTLRGKRYGEVLLVTVGPDGPQATVYNTFPLNDCPDDLWSRLDTDAIATRARRGRRPCSTGRATG